MPELITKHWEGDSGAYGGRRARAGFEYQAFVPDSIAALDLALPGPVGLMVSDAEGEIRALNAGPEIRNLEAIGPLLLRAESVASSRIEGIEISQRNLARALFDPVAARGSALAVAGNVRAMEAAIQIGDEDRPLSMDDILDVHRTLLEATEDVAIAGRIRLVQNWIGGRLNSPLDAAFVPPPPERVAELLEDLMVFVNREDLPAVVQAAIAHAQFETIHPFVDGNGRAGRCLIHIVLRRRHLAPRVVPPISMVLATNASAYVAGLTAFRQGDAVEWCRSFAWSSRLAAKESVQLGLRLSELVDDWRTRVRSRRGSSSSKVLELLPAQPIVSVATARSAVGGSDEAVRLALTSLERAGVLRQITVGRYARAWAADEVFDLLNSYEHDLATPTRADQPRRRAPHVEQKLQR